MKIISFNINGLRARLHQIDQIIEQHKPEIIGLQEIKVHDDQFPVDDIKERGYTPYFHGQKGHYGVALLVDESRVTVSDTFKGYPTDDEDAQRRMITGSFVSPAGESFHVLNGYFPQGESRDHPTKFPAKEAFYQDLIAYLNSNFSPDDNLVIMGDFNITPEDRDIGIGEANAKRWLRTGKCSFLPEERDWMDQLKAWGVSDRFHELNTNSEQKLSWFDYRTRAFNDDPKRGLRIDYHLTTSSMGDKATSAVIDYEIRGSEKPSDHAPVSMTFDL